MGFDTHMILEAVPAPHSNAQTAIRASNGHYATMPRPCLSTAANWGISKLDALRQLFTTGPWLPPASAPHNVTQAE